MSSRALIHIALHFAVPALVAFVAFRNQWLRPWFILCATMLVDLDHLLANPIYDPNRCSIGFHPLHTWPAICVYAVLVFPKKTRLVGVGLLIHMLLDTLDCSFMR
jgi:hypothetical protein